jgi:hypothetical protein
VRVNGCCHLVSLRDLTPKLMGGNAEH